MIKGVVFGVTVSMFIVSAIFLVAGITNGLQENVFTGAAIGIGELKNYSVGIAIVSFVVGVFLLVSIKNNYFRRTNS